MLRNRLAGLWRLLTLLVVSLWLGGMLTLFICVMALFTRDRATANVAAPILFDAFDLYQRVLAVAGVVLSALLAWTRPRLATFIVPGVLLLCAGGAAAMSFYVMPEMRDHLSENMQRASQFNAMHGLSEQIYTAIAILLLIPFFILSLISTRRAVSSAASGA